MRGRRSPASTIIRITAAVASLAAAAAAAARQHIEGRHGVVGLFDRFEQNGEIDLVGRAMRGRARVVQMCAAFPWRGTRRRHSSGRLSLVAIRWGV